MAHEEFQKALEIAQLEIEHLLKQRSEIDTRIAHLKSTAESLSRLLGTETKRIITRLAEMLDQGPADPGITNAIRWVLTNATVPLSVPEIKLRLETIGVPLSDYVNPSAVLHNTLSRLERQKQVMRVAIQDAAGPTTAYALMTLKQRVGEAGGVPNPQGKNLAEMLRKPEEKK